MSAERSSVSAKYFLVTMTLGSKEHHLYNHWIITSFRLTGAGQSCLSGLRLADRDVRASLTNWRLTRA